MKRVIIPEYILEEAMEDYRATLDFHFDPDLFKHPAALKAALKDAEGLIVRNQTRVDSELVAEATKLEVVGRLGVGLDNLDIPVLKARGIKVTWAPGTNAVSVAEYVMGAMLECARRFANISAQVHQGEWNRQAAMGSELRGKHLGIIGLGDIGGRLARRAQAFGMTVVAHDPVVHQSSFVPQEFNVFLMGLDSVLQLADFVSLHVPLLPTTRHMINAEMLALMKPSAYLINTARGGLIDEAALAEALQAGRLAGAVLDVREQEPPAESDPLRGLPNVILTPHIAGVTEESNRRASFHVMHDVVRVLLGAKPLSPAPGSG